MIVPVFRTCQERTWDETIAKVFFKRATDELPTRAPFPTRFSDVSYGCKCPCEAKIVTSPTNTILFISNPHTAEHHSKEKEKSVYLSLQEKTFVKKEVKISPMQCAGDLLRSVQDTNDAIVFSIKKSVQYHVRKELRGIRAYLLDDLEVDDTRGSLSRLWDKFWFKTALDQQNAGKSMDLFRVYCIGRQFMTEDSAIMFLSLTSGTFLTFFGVV